MATVVHDIIEGSAYNLCDASLLHPRFGVILKNVIPIPPSELSEEIRNRAKNFV